MLFYVRITFVIYQIASIFNHNLNTNCKYYDKLKSFNKYVNVHNNFYLLCYIGILSELFMVINSFSFKYRNIYEINILNVKQ